MRIEVNGGNSWSLTTGAESELLDSAPEPNEGSVEMRKNLMSVGQDESTVEKGTNTESTSSCYLAALIEQETAAMLRYPTTTLEEGECGAGTGDILTASVNEQSVGGIVSEQRPFSHRHNVRSSVL